MSSSKLASRSSSLLLRHTRLQKSYHKAPSSTNESRITPLQRLIFAEPSVTEEDFDADDENDNENENDIEEGDENGNERFDDYNGDVAEHYGNTFVDDNDNGEGHSSPMTSEAIPFGDGQGVIRSDIDRSSDVHVYIDNNNGINTRAIQSTMTSNGNIGHTVINPNILSVETGNYVNIPQQAPHTNQQHEQKHISNKGSALLSKSNKDKLIAGLSTTTKIESGLAKKGRSKSQNHHHSYQTYVSTIAKTRPSSKDDLTEMFSQLYLEQQPHPARIRNLTDIGNGSKQQKNLAIFLKKHK